jgi:hypothetical protein
MPAPLAGRKYYMRVMVDFRPGTGLTAHVSHER